MIKYILKCTNSHEFESWFSNSEEFDKLNKKGLLECIYCPSKKIKKSIMSPMISNNINSKNTNTIYKDLRNETQMLFGSAGATSMLTILGVGILLTPVLIRTWKEFKTER